MEVFESRFRVELAAALTVWYIGVIGTVQEIKAAIQNLSRAERKKLVASPPELLPELDGDAAWESIIRDARPRPALSALLDKAESYYRLNPEAFPETSPEEFDRRS